jgi:UDP-N-acetylglucosamine acyltransferase
MNYIHPSSLVDPAAQLGDDITIGPFCTIGPNVVLGDGCRLISHVVLEREATIGKGNTFHPFCIIGMDPTDKKYVQQDTSLEIGDENTFRESVSVHRGTIEGGGITKIGSRNLFMGFVHIAHDCILGDDIVLANYVGLSGHVTINDFAILGGQVGVVQFLSIGSHVYIGGGSIIDKNVPPFSTGYGNRLEIKGVNIVGLKRRGYPRSEITAISDAHRLYFRSGLSEVEALRQIEAELGESKQVREFTEFVERVGGKIR